MATRTRHAEEQRRYRTRLRERSKATADGTVAPLGAPETKVVVQALATAVRKLAAAARKSPTSPAAAVYGQIMASALKGLKKSGYDRAEAFDRLAYYTLSDAAKKRHQKAATEARYWAGSEAPE